MGSLSYVLFICIAVPVALMLPPIEKKSRKVIAAILTGMFCCLFVSEINGLLLKMTDSTTLYFTTNITPLTEEIVKLLPVLFYAHLFSRDRKSIVTVAFAVGVGFAMLENIIILTNHITTVNILFAVVRGFSSGLMHSICTMMASYFLSYLTSKSKVCLCGTICTFNLAIVFHSVFNMLVEAQSATAIHIGYFLPILAYSLLNYFYYFKKKEKAPEEEKAAPAQE